MKQITRYQYLNNPGKLTKKVEIDYEIVTQQGLALTPFTLVENQMNAGSKSQPIRILDNKISRQDFPLEENDLATSFNFVKKQNENRQKIAKQISDTYTKLKEENE